MKIIIVLILSYLSGLVVACSTTDVNAPRRMIVEVDPIMQETVNNFLSDCEKVLGREKCRPNIELQGKIRPLKEDTLGLCYIYENPEHLRRIFVDDNVTDPNLFRVVLYHELMHCVLEFPHHDDELDIMNSSADIISARSIVQFWESYVYKSLVRGE
jgi:hypothetical protein